MGGVRVWRSCATAPSEAAGWDARGLLLCPLCPAQASWLLGPSSREETNPGSPSTQQFCPTKEADPPKTPHQQQPTLRFITCQQPQRHNHMHCQPLWAKANHFRNTCRSHTSIQAKQLQQDSPDYHHIRKQKRPNIRHSLAVNCRMSIVYHMSYNRLCAPTQCTPN